MTMRRKMRWLAVPAMGAAVCLLGSFPAAYAAGSQAPAYVQHDEGGWDQPPSDYRDVKRQGFHDGIEAARWDVEHHRHADADDHEHYRHPHVDRGMRDDYREGFRHGYDVAMHHMMDHPDYH